MKPAGQQIETKTEGPGQGSDEPRTTSPQAPTTGSPTRAIIQATTIVTGIILVVKGLGFVEKLLLAYYFGTGPQVDAYLVAYSIIFSAYVVLREVVRPSFLPTFQKIWRSSAREGWRLFSIVGTITAVTAWSRDHRWRASGRTVDLPGCSRLFRRTARASRVPYSPGHACLAVARFINLDHGHAPGPEAVHTAGFRRRQLPGWAADLSADLWRRTSHGHWRRPGRSGQTGHGDAWLGPGPAAGSPFIGPGHVPGTHRGPSGCALAGCSLPFPLCRPPHRECVCHPGWRGWRIGSGFRPQDR